jgi:hypothetical protein
MVIMDPDREWVFSADPLGRISWVHTPGKKYRRSHFNQWYRLKRDLWNALDVIDTNEITDAVTAWRPVWERAYKKATEPLKQRLHQWVDRFADFHREDGERFSSVYQSIPILPPDAYQTLYIQLSRGCPWNQCAFCNFYKDRDYQVPGLDDLAEHLHAVRDYWKGALGGRNGLFLGDANAIAIPMEGLVERLRLVRTKFPEDTFARLASFSDFFSAPNRADYDFARLRQEGLQRICMGIESGHLELLEQIDKALGPKDISNAIQRAKAGDIRVSLIFIVGLGGYRYREPHFRYSMELLSRLPLERCDRIYLSPLVVQSRPDYTEVARTDEWELLTNGEVEVEMARWKNEIVKLHPTLPVSLYNIQLFTY